MARRILVVTQPAQNDLDEIYDYVAHDSPQSAERFVERLLASLAKVARTGSSGVPRDVIRPGLRLHVHGNYCCYFRIIENRLVVLRIVSSARDVGRIAFDDQ